MKLGKRVAVATMIAMAAGSVGCQAKAQDHEAPATPKTTAALANEPVATTTPPPALPPPAATPANGNADPWAAKAPPKKDPLAHPLLWAAEKDGKTTYFIGTIHMGVDADQRMPDIVWEDLDAEPTFAMETDLTSVDPSSLKRTSGTLHEDLGPEYWKKLQDTLTPRIARAIDDQKASVAASFMSLRGLPSTPPMDETFLSRAQTQHKTIVYLEPASTQLALIEKWLDARALKEMLDDLPHGEQQTKDMLAAYVAGDDTKIAAINDDRAEFKKAGRTDAEYDESLQDLLYGRNASWIAEIEKLHAAGGRFVAVGAIDRSASAERPRLARQGRLFTRSSE